MKVSSLCHILPWMLFVQYSSAHYSTSPDTTFIYDDYGRVSFFHGANMVAKGDPWYPASLLDLNNVAEIKSWGFNTIRLGVMWTGVEPTLGNYNQTYLDIICQILDNLEANGIAALIDVHQDVLSSYFCLYDGAPTWAVDLSNSSTHAFPWPLSTEEGVCNRPWFENYFAEATGAAFQDLYQNTNNLRDHFASFWKQLALSFKDKHILGYEIINEPWAGNIYADPSLLLPGVAGATNLQPFYDAIAAAIREVDSEHIIFYEPVTWGMIFNGTLSGSGFSHVPGGDAFADKSVFSFHYYCWWYGNGKEHNDFTCDRAFGPLVFDQAMSDASQLGGAAMLTEWGQGCNPAEGLIDECNAIMDLADSRLMSWQNWFFFPDIFTWSVPPENIPVFSRTYAKSVAGVPSRMHFDSNTAKFELCYTPNDKINEPTEIYINSAIHYANGVDIQLFGNGANNLFAQVSSEDSNLITVSWKSTLERLSTTDEIICILVKPV